MKTSYASPSYTLIEEHTFLDTETTNQVTASQDHSLCAMTQRERKYRSLRQRPPNPSFASVPTKSQRTGQGSPLAASCIYAACPLSFLAVYPTTRLINSVFHGASTGGGGSTCRMRNHVAMLTYVRRPLGICLAWLSGGRLGLISQGRPLGRCKCGTSRPPSNPGMSAWHSIVHSVHIKFKQGLQHKVFKAMRSFACSRS